MGNKKQDNFTVVCALPKQTQIPTTFALDRTVSLAALGLYARLSAVDDFTWTESNVEELTRTTYTSIIPLLDELRLSGLMSIVTEQDGSKTYTLLQPKSRLF